MAFSHVISQRQREAPKVQFRSLGKSPACKGEIQLENRNCDFYFFYFESYRRSMYDTAISFY
jgi:hypothetical protein